MKIHAADELGHCIHTLLEIIPDEVKPIRVNQIKLNLPIHKKSKFWFENGINVSEIEK